MSEPENSLISRLGGPPAIAEMIEDMYSRILADPELAPFFKDTSMERLQKMQYEFIVAAFDGPVAYTGAELTAVHRGRGITGQHFAKFCSHFADAMETRGVSAADVDAALGRLAMYKLKITGESTTDG